MCYILQRTEIWRKHDGNFNYCLSKLGNAAVSTRPNSTGIGQTGLNSIIIIPEFDLMNYLFGSRQEKTFRKINVTTVR